MNLVPYTNDRKHAVNIDGKLIQPGDTRMVDPTRVPNGYRKQLAERAAAAPKPEAPSRNPILELLELSVSDLVERISDVDKVSAEDLDALEAAENAGKTRKTAIAAIQEERLERAKLPPATDAVNLGELLDGEEAEVLLKIETLKKAVDEGAGLTQEAIDQLLHAEEHGGNRDGVKEAICELEPKDATESKEGKGLLSSLFGRKD